MTLLVTSNFKWKIFSNFVAFSEYPNFKCNLKNILVPLCTTSILSRVSIPTDWPHKVVLIHAVWWNSKQFNKFHESRCCFKTEILLNTTLKIVCSHCAVLPSSRGYQSQQIDLVKLGMKAIIIQLDGPFDSDRQQSTVVIT